MSAAPAWLMDLRLETRPIAGAGGYLLIAPERVHALLALVETLAGALRPAANDDQCEHNGPAVDALAAYLEGPR